MRKNKTVNNKYDIGFYNVTGKQKKDNHLLKLDHILFILIAPAILLESYNVALLFWLGALLYDIYEDINNKEK